MEPKKMSQFIRTLRKEKNLTQEQLAEALFVSGKTVSRWETGSSLPDLIMLQNIADYFGVQIRELIDGERLPEDARDREVQKENVQKMSEYSDKKEKCRSRKQWILFCLIILCAGAAAGFFIWKYRENELDQTRQMQAVGAVQHYSVRENGCYELYLLCDETRIVRFMVTPDTRIDSETLKYRLEAREKGLILFVQSSYTEREERAAQKQGGEYAYPLTAVNYADPSQYVPDTPSYTDRSGWKPLEELLDHYTRVEAEADGCVVMEGVELIHGEQRWTDFLKRVRAGFPAVIRIYSCTGEEAEKTGYYFLKELEYDGSRYHIVSCGQWVKVGVWQQMEGSFAYLTESTTVNYESKRITYLLADTPSVNLLDSLSGILGVGIYGMYDIYGIDDMLLQAVLTWDVSDHPERRTAGMYGIETADINGDGLWEKCFLGCGKSSGAFTFSLQIYGRTEGLLYAREFSTVGMRLSFVRTESGELCVQGITDENPYTHRPSETHLYHIVIRNGVPELEENGEALPSSELR